MGLDHDYKDGQTPLDEDEKEGLLIKTVTTRGELDEFEQLGVEKANEWLLPGSLVGHAKSKPCNSMSCKALILIEDELLNYSSL